MRPPAQTSTAPDISGLLLRLLPTGWIHQEVVERVKKTIPGSYRNVSARNEILGDEPAVLVLTPRLRIIGSNPAARRAESILPELAPLRFRRVPAGTTLTLGQPDIVATSMGETGWIVTFPSPDRSAAIRERAGARVAHKIRNSLSTILLTFNLIRSDLARLLPPDQARDLEENLARCESEAATLDQLMESLKSIGLPPKEDRPERISVDALLKQTSAFFNGDLADISAESDLGEITARPFALRTTILLLVQRVVESSPPRSRIELRGRREGDGAVIEIRADSEFSGAELEAFQPMAAELGGTVEIRLIPGGSAICLILPSEGPASAEQ